MYRKLNLFLLIGEGKKVRPDRLSQFFTSSSNFVCNYFLLCNFFIYNNYRILKNTFNLYLEIIQFDHNGCYT